VIRRSVCLTLLALAWLSAAADVWAQHALIVVRHAERLDDTQNSPLSPAGLERAKVLAAMLRDMDIKAIYATQRLRTQQTVRPLAEALGLSVTVAKGDDIKSLIGQLKGKHAADVVVVVAHSDTLPEILAAYGFAPPLKIAPDEYDSLFVIVPKGTAPATILRFRY
jgi:broad specificity phosphatase PhoE